MKALAGLASASASASRAMSPPGPAAHRDALLLRREGMSGLARHQQASARIESAAVTWVAITPPDRASRRRASWRGMAAEMIDIAPHGRIELRFRAPAHLLLVLESGRAVEPPASAGASTFSVPNARKRELVLVPAGQDFVDLLEPRGLARLACFYFDPPMLPLDADVAVSSRLFFDDADLLKTALKLTAAVDMPGDDRPYREALGIVLAHDLARLAPRARRSAQTFRGGLAGWQQQAVAAHIDQHLADRIPLTELAALVRLSPYHFARAFKQSFGVPPHRYHTQRRIERAKARLADPETSATEIAMAVGFSSASAFTMTFRKVTGTTPTDYRRTLI
jgi:AraC family transcriptional regulator